METEQATSPSPEAVDSVVKLYNAIHAAFPRAVAQFNSKRGTAHAVCSLLASVNDATYLQTYEFNALEKLDPKIIPFVVFKLVNNTAQNLWAVDVYHALEKDPVYRANVDGGLQRQRSQIVELNFQRNKLAEERIRDWDNYCWENRFTVLPSSTPAARSTSNCSRWGLGGFYYQLLHEIIFGRKMGAAMIQKPVEYEEWWLFFNDIDHDQAPEYIPNAFDRSIYRSSDIEVTCLNMAASQQWAF
ncbi:hypothetical protein PG994_005371 [Apiospora phragmitis]|uniref:Uncharacterized protein n=1 Tax=Apiospora phragmitis TaxID=2905665 RepID=A0ABR1VC24_9PEZI